MSRRKMASAQRGSRFLDQQRWDILHRERLPSGATALAPMRRTQLQAPANLSRPSRPAEGAFARVFARGDVVALEGVAASLALVLGAVIIDSAGGMTQPSTASAIGWSLVLLGPLNVALSYLLSRRRESGPERVGLWILKIVTMAVLLPLLALVLLVTALFIWSMSHDTL